MIRFENVTFSYRRGEPVFDRLDLEIGPGMTLVLGVNGSGKSTLLKLAAGVESPDAGSVFVPDDRSALQCGRLSYRLYERTDPSRHTGGLGPIAPVQWDDQRNRSPLLSLDRRQSGQIRPS